MLEGCSSCLGCAIGLLVFMLIGAVIFWAFMAALFGG
jgi:hypothetical protein